jgi:membrane protease subunit HflC
LSPTRSGWSRASAGSFEPASRVRTSGRGDAEAAAIYADAYNRSRELYRFLKTMETYRNTIDKSSWLLLSTRADLYRYLQSSEADKSFREGRRPPRRMDPGRRSK